MEQLAPLASVKAWLGDKASTADDALLTRLIQQASSFILNYIQRASMFKASYTDVKDGLGGNTTILEQYAVQEIESVIVGTQTITASPALPQVGAGYFLQPWNGYAPGKAQALQLNGYTFPPGNGNVQIQYKAGFYITDEAATVPASSAYIVTVAAPKGNWGRNDGVTLADGTPLTEVTGTPGALQYSATAGVYTFNAAQASAAVLISYSYIPPDIEQFCIEIVGERYRYLKRIGQSSQSAAGQVTTSFSLKDLQDYVKEGLNAWRRKFYSC